MKKAVFLDRDGVINNNSQHYYIFHKEQLNYIPDIFSIVKRFNDDGYLVIVISNQGGISRGLYTTNDVDKLHDKMCADAKSEGATITDFFYCPHHDKVEACLCRKPSSLLIERAASKYGIDLSQSFMIGDSDRDIQAGRSAGLKDSIKITSNESAQWAADEILGK
jgi:D-glycero-D-manno-heptose 1,7-bisphosphate phosphatase